MSEEHEKIKQLPGEKSLKVPFMIYADLECLLKKVRFCQNNLENSYKEKKVKSKPLGYVWCSIVQYACLMIQKIDAIFIGEKIEKDCIEKFYKDLKELGTEIVNFEEKEMMPLTNKDIESYQK